MSTAEPSPYYRAVSEADQDLEDALSQIRAEEDAQRISPAEACTEHASLLERHLQRCQALRREYRVRIGPDNESC